MNLIKILLPLLILASCASFSEKTTVSKKPVVDTQTIVESVNGTYEKNS